MLLFLIGFMGSGKSTLGKRLARKIEFEFVDMDTAIEEQEGLSVKQIFEERGEKYFRYKETQFFQELDANKNIVIATGGGAPCFGQNMQIMNQMGITVYLKMTPRGLASRLQNATELRPLISDMDGDELLDYITQKLREREPFYSQSKCIIKAENVKPEHVISLVFDNHS